MMSRPLQSLPGSEGPIVQSVFDEPSETHKISVEHFLGKRFLRLEVIGERALRNASGRADIPDARRLIASTEHDLETGFENGFAMGGPTHERTIRTSVLRVKLFL